MRLTNAPSYDVEISPDREWMSYSSFSSGRSEIFVQRLRPGGGKWSVSTNGGSMSRWSRDMKEIFYQSTDQKLMAASIDLQSSPPQIGLPKPLFDTRTLSTGGMGFGARQQYAVARDGQRLLLNEATAGARSEVVVVLNWDARLKQ